MTIYTSKPGEKKDENKLDPEVVTDPLPEKGPKFADVPSTPLTEYPSGPAVVAISAQRRRRKVTNMCVVICALLVLASGVVGGIYLYRHLAHRTFRGWCGVRYYEWQDLEDNNHHEGTGHFQRHTGQFEEEVELDKEYGRFEKINVPEFDECRKATILHDFEKNVTAIVDKDKYRCFLMPLNRTMVKPPNDFWDLIKKLRTGYYLPDAVVVREKYRVMQPPVQNLSPLGYYIWRECRRFDTYRLEKVKPGQPIALTKRSISKREANSNLNYGLFNGDNVQKIEIAE